MFHHQYSKLRFPLLDKHKDRRNRTTNRDKIKRMIEYKKEIDYMKYYLRDAEDVEEVRGIL